MELENPNAFPFSAEYGHPAACGGMTLRDWFAGQAALPAIGLAEQFSKDASPMPMAASLAYEFADAMLAARKGGSHD